MIEHGGIARLLAIMARLRDPETGCPWDREQDFRTIAPYTIEEAYEVADAIERGDFDDLRDELGDLLFQVVFHARMAEEAGRFDFDAVVMAICDKMERRHPHVFAAAPIADADAQSRAWEAHKRAERSAHSQDDSALAGIARGLPEWQRALKLQKRAAGVGFDWPDPEPVLAKLAEEIEEVRAEFAAFADADRQTGTDRSDPGSPGAEAAARLADEIGDVLFVCVNLARHARVDPGAALRAANRKFERRFRRMEALAAEAGLALPDLDLAAQETLWDRAKVEERSAGQ